MALCDLSSESALFPDNNLTFFPHSILFLKTRISKTSDPLFARTSLPLDTFARGYQLPLLWSWICRKTGSNLSVEQVPQHAVSLGAKILFKIVWSVFDSEMRCSRCFCVDIKEHTHSLYMFVWPEAARQHSAFSSLLNFLTFLRLHSSSAVMSACVRGYACES